MTTKAFKVQMLPLTKIKVDKLNNMAEAYGRVYNFAANFMPSLPEKYLDKNASLLYTKWIKSKVIDYTGIQAGDAHLAVIDAAANWKATHYRTQMKEPHIIKLASTRYKIVKETSGHFGLIIKSEKIYLPLITGNHDRDLKRPEKRRWGLVEHLETAIAIQNGDAKILDKRGRVKKGVGAITLNLRDNSISIPITIESQKFKKKTELTTFIGIDRNVRPQNFVSVAAIQIIKPLTRQNVIDLDKALDSGARISRNLLTAIGVEYKISVELFGGLKTASQMKHLKKIRKERQKSGKIVGHRLENIQESTADQVSRKIVNFSKQFQNPIIFFEDLQNFTGAKKKTGKSGGKSLRKMLNSWNYGELKSKTEYKLKESGMYVMEVNPQYTSQRCSKCGAIGIRSQKDNTFMCSACGYGVGSSPTGVIGQMHADINASINIALKGFWVLYGSKKGKVYNPNVEPSENITNPIPTEMTGVDGIKTRKSEPIEQKTKSKESRSIVRGSRQSIVAMTNAVDSVPEKLQVGSHRFSSLYKGSNKKPVRTKSKQKIDSGEVP